MDTTAVTIRVPATSANLGAGFDCLGLALDMNASITVSFGEEPLPPTEDVGEKMVLTAARATYDRIGKEPPPGLNASYGLGIPLGRGLGASAVARVAGILAVNEREGHPLDDAGKLAVASQLEGHADNAAPALFGGMQVAANIGGKYVSVPCRYPGNLHIALLIPDHSMPTKEARRALPASYSKEDAIHNTGRASLFVAAMQAGRLDLLDAATDDRFHQRQRSSLFPPMYDIFAAAKQAGAHAAWLSGAGSTIAAVCSEGEVRAVADAMLARLEEAGMSGRSMHTRIAPEGATVAKMELVTE